MQKTAQAGTVATRYTLWNSQAKTAFGILTMRFMKKSSGVSQKRKRSSTKTLKKCDPFIEELIKVGGRLQSADLSELGKHPLIIPASQHVATVPVRHYHNQVAHHCAQQDSGLLDARGLFTV